MSGIFGPQANPELMQQQEMLTPTDVMAGEIMGHAQDVIGLIRQADVAGVIAPVDMLIPDTPRNEAILSDSGAMVTVTQNILPEKTNPFEKGKDKAADAAGLAAVAACCELQSCLSGGACPTIHDEGILDKVATLSGVSAAMEVRKLASNELKIRAEQKGETFDGSSPETQAQIKKRAAEIRDHIKDYQTSPKSTELNEADTTNKVDSLSHKEPIHVETPKITPPIHREPRQSVSEPKASEAPTHEVTIPEAVQPTEIKLEVPTPKLDLQPRIETQGTVSMELRPPVIIEPELPKVQRNTQPSGEVIQQPTRINPPEREIRSTTEDTKGTVDTTPSTRTIPEQTEAVIDHNIKHSVETSNFQKKEAVTAPVEKIVSKPTQKQIEVEETNYRPPVIRVETQSPLIATEQKQKQKPKQKKEVKISHVEKHKPIQREVKKKSKAKPQPTIRIHEPTRENKTHHEVEHKQKTIQAVETHPQRPVQPDKPKAVVNHVVEVTSQPLPDIPKIKVQDIITEVVNVFTSEGSKPIQSTSSESDVVTSEPILQRSEQPVISTTSSTKTEESVLVATDEQSEVKTMESVIQIPTILDKAPVDQPTPDLIDEVSQVVESLLEPNISVNVENLVQVVEQPVSDVTNPTSVINTEVFKQSDTGETLHIADRPETSSSIATSEPSPVLTDIVDTQLHFSEIQDVTTEDVDVVQVLNQKNDELLDTDEKVDPTETIVITNLEDKKVSPTVEVLVDEMTLQEKIDQVTDSDFVTQTNNKSVEINVTEDQLVTTVVKATTVNEELFNEELPNFSVTISSEKTSDEPISIFTYEPETVELFQEAIHVTEETIEKSPVDLPVPDKTSDIPVNTEIAETNSEPVFVKTLEQITFKDVPNLVFDVESISDAESVIKESESETLTESADQISDQIERTVTDEEEIIASEIAITPLKIIEAVHVDLPEIIGEIIEKMETPPVAIISFTKNIPQEVDEDTGKEIDVKSNTADKEPLDQQTNKYELFALDQKKFINFLQVATTILEVLTFLSEQNADKPVELDELTYITKDMNVTPEELKNDTFGQYDDPVKLVLWYTVQVLNLMNLINIFMPVKKNHQKEEFENVRDQILYSR